LRHPPGNLARLRSPVRGTGDPAAPEAGSGEDGVQGHDTPGAPARVLDAARSQNHGSASLLPVRTESACVQSSSSDSECLRVETDYRDGTFTVRSGWSTCEESV